MARLGIVTLLAGSLLGACAAPASSEGEPESTLSSESGSESSSESGPTASTESGMPSSSGEADLPCPPAPCDACSCVDGVLTCDCPPPAPEAGFLELPGVSYELGQGEDSIAAQSSAARWFWAYQGAREDPEHAPVFVFFNGGPGVSSGMLLGLNTGEASFAPAQTGPDLAVAPNPAAWTELGHLVWIDARQAGFSYGLIEPPASPSDPDVRAANMSLDNFNSYRDAADFVRTVVGFLAEHPQLRDNPIVLVGESYGGTRAQLMLDMVLHPTAYADGSRKLRDETLSSAIIEHHLAVGANPEDPASIAAQFGHQVLIQPALTGSVQQVRAGELFEQPGSVMDEVAAELGVDYPTCAELGGSCNPYDHALDWVVEQGRSSYDYRAPATWLSETFSLVGARLNDPQASAALLGVELDSIAAFRPAARTQAWRAHTIDLFPTDDELGDWPLLAGNLEPWDRYFTVLNTEVLFEFRSAEARALDLDPGDPHFGELLLSNLVWVDTLITHARFDIVIHAPAIAAALSSYANLTEEVLVDEVGETWTVVYRDEVGVEGGQRSIYVPSYAAGHAVSLDAPIALRDDVEAWL